MTCAPFDLKDYFFGELNSRERELVDQHVEACRECRDELATLSATRSAVLLMREEEPPRRIAFVSDKVFEPRWWQKLLTSGPKLGFASAAMLSAAIVFHAVQAPGSVPATPRAPVAQVDMKAVEAEVAKRLQGTIDAAIAQGEAQQAERLLHILNAQSAQNDRRYEMQLKTFEHYFEKQEKRNSNVRRAYFDGVVQ